jgi:fructose-bisphosphate aldolase, class I
MSNYSRWNRLFGNDGNCFDVAIDHGFFNEKTYLTGIEDMEEVIKKIVNANPDAIQLSIG